MKKKIIHFSTVFVFFAGLLVFLYPVAAEIISRLENQKQIQAFEERSERQQLTEEDTPQESMSWQEKDIGNEELLMEMQEYNREIYENGQKDLTDPFSYEKPSFELRDWGLEDGMFGYLTIPKMNLKLPVYLGATKENLALGGAHLSKTSLPIGGRNTNAVIAAHRGTRRSGPMFENIQVLEEGDQVIFRNPWDTLNYRVAEIKIILPNEIDQVLIQENRDLITLITCHPYTKNYQRYVVYCEREDPEQESPSAVESREEREVREHREDTEDREDRKPSGRDSFAMDLEHAVRAVVSGVLAAGMLWWITRKIFKRKRR